MRELRLQSSLIMMMLTVVLLTFSIVGGALLFIRLPQIEGRLRSELQERSAHASLLLDQTMSGIEGRIEPLVRLLADKPGLDAQAHVDAIVGDGSTFDAVLLLDQQGFVKHVGLPAALRGAALELLHGDFSSNPLFAKLGATTMGSHAGPVWSDRYLSVAAGRNTVGVAWRAGEHILIGEASLDRILSMLKEAARHDESLITILDRRGQWLASTHPNPKPSYRLLNYRALPSFKAAQEGSPPPEYEYFQGRKFLASVSSSDKLGWMIAATSPAGWSNYAYRVTVWLILGGFFGSMLISLLVTPVWAARMVRPLKALIAHTHAVALGDQQSPWPRQGMVAELNQLSADLAGMVTTMRAHEIRLRATLENTPSVAIQWYDISGRILYWNKASELMYGFSADEALHVRLDEQPLMYLDQAQVQLFLSVLRNIAEGGQAFGPAEFALRHKDGTGLVVLASTFSIPGDKGELIFVCMDVDITAQKQVHHAMRNSEQKLEAIFNASPAPMSVSDINNDFRVINVNSAWERQFQRKRSEVIGLTGTQLKLWASDTDRAGLLAALEQDGRRAEIESELCTGQGERKLCSISAKIAEIGQDRLLLVMAVDITERRRIECEIRELNARLEERVAQRTEELSQTNDELEATITNLQSTQEQLVRSEKLAALGKLVAGVAHELNTPIGNGLMAVSTLHGQLEQLRDSMSKGLRRAAFDQFLANVDESCDIATRNLGHAADLVHSFKQVAVDQTSAQRRGFELAQLVDEVLLTLRPSLKKFPFRIDVEIPAGLLFDSFPGALGQVLTNLINNAITHAFDERAEGRIEIRAHALPVGRVAISVQDDGVGIAPELLGRIYDPFYTTRMGRGGTGLGLHVLHGLVTNVLGGTVQVSSNLNKGTAFLIDLPTRAPLCVAAEPVDAI